MSSQVQQAEKDHFVLYMVIGTVVLVGAILAVKLSENEKFEPIKQQIESENKQMNIRVLSQRGD